MKKRFLSMLLVLVMVIGMIPFSALSASADQSTASTSGTTVEVTTWDELKTALSGSADATVIVKQKIEKTLNNASESGISCTGNKTLVLENDVIVTVQNSILEGSYFDGIITIGVSGNLTIKGSGSFLGKIDAGYLAADSISSKRNNFVPVVVSNFGKFIMNGGTVGGVDIDDNMFGALWNRYGGYAEINGGVLQGVCNVYKRVKTVGIGAAEDIGIYQGQLGIGVIMRVGEYEEYYGNISTIVINSGEIRSLTDNDNFYHTYWIADCIYHIPEYLGTGLQTVNWLDMGGWDNVIINGGKFTSNTGAKITWTEHNDQYPITQDDVCEFLAGKTTLFTKVTHSADYKTIEVVEDLEAIGFSSLTPTPDMDEADWDELSSDLGTMALGSADTNIDFNFSAKTLPADAIEAGYSVKRVLKVTRDGITIYDKEYTSNEVYPWNLKNNIDEGGNYHIIPTLNYYLDGVKIEEISHLYTVKVTGSTIKTLTASGIATPVIGSAPSHAEFAKTNTDGVYIYEIEWYRAEEDSYSGWVMMTEGETFVTGERYMVTVTFKTNDGYSFKDDPTLMKAYINGVEATVVENPYSTNKAYVDLEFTPITDPAFIVKPVGGNVAEGDKFTITWETNFKPAWIEILSFNSANGAPNKSIEVPADATSFELDANEFGYVLNVYYNGNQCVSNGEKFYVNEIKTIVNTIEIEVAKPVIGEAPTKPTIKSVNMDENLKDLVSFFSDSKVYWVEADSAEDIANGNKNPTIFADGKIYALHVAIQSTKEIGDDCYLQVYDTNGERLWAGYVSFSDPSDKTLVYTDAYLGNFKLEIGNVNGDDLIDFTDLQRLYQHITGDNPLSSDALGAADVNADTVIDFSDLQALFTLLSQNA